MLNGAAALAMVGAVGALLAASRWVHPAVYIPIAGALLGATFFGLIVLVVHEGSHDMFLLGPDHARTRRLNRAAGTAVGIAFLTDYRRHWERGHRIHHLRPCAADDPQEGDPLTGDALRREVLRVATIPGWFALHNPSRQYGGAGKRAAMAALFWTPILTGAVLFGTWAAPVALVVGLQTLTVLNLAKKAQEHGGGLAHQPDPMRRARSYFHPLTAVIAPFFIHHHFAHHLNWAVPWYRLPAYHARLLTIVPADQAPFYFHDQIVRQWQGRLPLPPLQAPT